MRFRQVHLDFHTSEKIMPIGQSFDPDAFCDTLERAHVNSVTCFSRCHHGMLYYDSQAFPELVHPGLSPHNLLERQVHACHARGIKAPIYTSVQWDDHMSKLHPEWVCLNPDGSFVYYCRPGHGNVYEAGFYRTLCVNSPYREYLKAQIADVVRSLGKENVDGLFLDIVSIVDCSCKHCVEGMLREGYCPEEETQRLRYAKHMMDAFKREMTAYIKTLVPFATIFYNCGHINPQAVDTQDAFTHWEIESLPSGDWGYSHFVNTIRYARTTGYDCLAQTGKFHTSWGDFHSFKNVEALTFECMRMLAYNSKCLIGDQLEPCGRLSPPVYDLIGSVYEEVERREPWCEEARALTDIAIYTDEGVNVGTCGSVPNAVNGACQMMDELAMQLDIVDRRTDFAAYKVVIFPDTVLFDAFLNSKVQAYLNAGGKVLLTNVSGLNSDLTGFASTRFGLEYIGEAPFSPDFIIPGNQIGASLPHTEHVMYLRGSHVEARGARVLCQTCTPYFNRTWAHFCSHKHTPSSGKMGCPAVLINDEGNCVYMMHPVFTQYWENHPRWVKVLVRDCLRQLLPQPLLTHDGPSTVIAALNEQPRHNRYVLHLLHYIPVKTSERLYTIEDVIPLHDLTLTLHLPREISGARIVPDGDALPFSGKGGTVHITIPRINGNAIIEFTY